MTINLHYKAALHVNMLPFVGARIGIIHISLQTSYADLSAAVRVGLSFDE